jgi:hypothetical protein
MVCSGQNGPKKFTTMFKNIVSEEQQTQLECDMQVFNKHLIQQLLVATNHMSCWWANEGCSYNIISMTNKERKKMKNHLLGMGSSKNKMMII